MKRAGRLLALGMMAIASACLLTPYPDGLVTCSVSGEPCPDGYGCFDPQRTGQTTCVALGCGDGQVDTKEDCDDANDNDLDLCVRCEKRAYVPEVISGLGEGGGEPTKTPIGRPTLVTSDRDGSLFIASIGTNQVTRLDVASHQITTFAGNGGLVSLSNQQVVAANEIATVFASGLAVDGVGNVFIADLQASVIHRVGVDGQVVVVAGTGIAAEGGEDVLAATTPVNLVTGIAVDGDGTLYFTERGLDPPVGLRVDRVRRIDRITGRIRTILESAGGAPLDLDFDRAGRLHVFFVGGIATYTLAQDGAATLRRVKGLAGNCPQVRRSQEKFAVDIDGDTAFYPADQTVVAVDLKTTADDAPCRVVATAPGTAGRDVGAFALSPSDLTVVGTDLVVSDPGNGVVWRVPIEGGTLVEEAGLNRAGEADPFLTLVSDLLLEFAKQTDARLTANETDECNVVRTEFDHFEFLAPLPDQHRVLLSSCKNEIRAIAGNGEAGFSGDGGPSAQAALTRPTAAIRGPDGAIYIADRDNDRIRRVAGEPNLETIETFIGGDAPTAPGDAATLDLLHPVGLALDSAGRLLISDSGHHRIIRVDVVTGDVTPMIGTGVAGDNGNDLAPEQTQINEPSAMAFLPYSFIIDGAEGGLLVFAERGGHRLRGVMDPPLLPGLPPVFTIAGTGEPGDDDNDTDGLQARFFHPRGLMLAPPTEGQADTLNMLVIDAFDRVRSVSFTINLDITGIAFASTVTTVTARDDNDRGFPSRDDGGINSAQFRSPAAMTFLDAEHLLVVDRLTGRLRNVAVADNAAVTVAGLPDGLPATTVPTLASATEPLTGPRGLALDLGVEPPVVYVSEPRLNRLRRFQLVNPDDPSTWTTDVMVLDGELHTPTAVAVDAASHRLLVTETGSQTVAAIDLDVDVPTVSVIAGSPFQRGFAGDGGQATAALLNGPAGLTVTADGVVFIADTDNNRVRRVDVDGVISTVLGDGTAGSGGEGFPSSAFPVQAPRGLATDDAGNLVVTSQNAIRMVQAGNGGLADGDDDVASIFGAPPRAAFPEGVSRCLEDLAMAPTGPGQAPDVYAIDACLGIVVRLTSVAAGP